jgi:serine/threonine-protein kinase
MQSGFTSRHARIPAGTRLNGIYEIDHSIGAGGMGEIYKGHNIQTGDVVAIKLMLPELAENEAAMALFRKEASALHSLYHEAIVRYYVFTVEPMLQRPYLAMEFVEGQSLSDLLKHGPLTFEAMYALKYRLATGLQAAHERGVIHRDVSPDNIIIPGGDVSRAKIIDFGIARSTQIGEGTVIGGGFAGKYNYVSPEQLGLFGGDVTGRSDIYSLGLLLAETLTGQPIDMGGSQFDVVEKRRKVPHLGAIDLRVRPLLEKMLQPDPANRPDSMAAVAAWQVGAERPQRVEQVRRGQGAALERSARGGGGRKAAIAAGIAVLLLGGGAAGYYYYSEILQAPPAAPAAPGLKSTASLSGPPLEVARPAQDAPAIVRPEAGPSVSATNPAARPQLAPERPAAAPAVQGQQALRPDAVPTLSPALPASPVESATRPTARPSQQAGLNAPAAPAHVETPPAPSLTPARPEPGLPPVASLTPPESGQVPAVLPSRPQSELSAPALPQASLGATDPITRYINDYQGGDCFFILPVAVSAHAAKIEGYGASIAPFNTLDEAFKRAHRFEADIGVRQVTKAQCPAISFLQSVRKGESSAPRLEINLASLKSGQALTGKVDGYGGRHIELLLVSDEGSVLNVSSLLKSSGTGKTFNLRMQRTGAAGPQPQLLIAVASAKKLDTLQPRGAVEADLFFPLVAGEAGRSGERLSAAARYFKLDL